MNKEKLKSIANNLIDTFFKAGNTAKEFSHRGVKIVIKKDKTPVTDGDLAVDEMLRNKILTLTPDIPIISEETVNINQQNKSKNFWLIDPIDGTKEYIRKKQEYTLNAALIINLKPALGIIYAPEKDRLFYSYGHGDAYEIDNGKIKQLNCKKKTEKGKIFAIHHSSEPTDDILKVHKENKVSSFVKMSSSLKFCVIAAGEADLFVARPRAYEWDIAAGHAILEHSGGYVTTLDRKKILYGKSEYKNPAILVKRSKNLSI